MVDLMDLLRDVLVCSLQVWMLNDFGKNMFPWIIVHVNHLNREF